MPGCRDTVLIMYANNFFPINILRRKTFLVKLSLQMISEEVSSNSMHAVGQVDSDCRLLKLKTKKNILQRSLLQPFFLYEHNFLKCETTTVSDFTDVKFPGTKVRYIFYFELYVTFVPQKIVYN